MSKMNELYEKVATSEALQKEFAEITEKATKDNLEEIQKKLISFAEKQGYDISIKEMTDFFEGMVGGSTQLSEAELDAVAGGKDVTTAIITSIFTVGIICAGQSIVNAVEGGGKNCSVTEGN